MSVNTNGMFHGLTWKISGVVPFAFLFRALEPSMTPTVLMWICLSAKTKKQNAL